MSIVHDDVLERARTRLDDLHRFQELGLICKSGEFYPSVHYPPITMYPEADEDELFDGYQMPADGLLDVYAHIPFCEQRCLFCHYPVKLGPQVDEKNRYLAAFEREMDIYMRRLGIDKIRARSILVGGGTPTFLSHEQLDRFLDFFTSRIDLSECKQFNYDLDPGSLIGPKGLKNIEIMKSYGVDRVTIGIQSLHDEILKLMNRPHDKAAALQSIENSLEAGLQVNIEFIFGHPGETLQNWVEVIEEAVQLNVHEIQMYRLKVEAYGDYQGPIKKYIEKHPDRVPTLDDTIVMKQAAIEILREHGYRENLRRVFSRERQHYSHYAHNQCCELYDEVGFGLTAFSSLRDRFVLNTQSFAEYYEKIEAGKLPLNRGLKRNREQQLRWSIILPLKNRDVWKPRFQERTGESLNDVFRPKIEALKEHGLVTETEDVLALTPMGCFFADEVVEQFNHADFKPFPREEHAEGPLNPFRDCDP